MRLISILSVIALSLSSCGPDFIYEESYNIPGDAWAYQDTVNFDFAIEDTLRIYNLYLEVEHSRDYSFQNLYTRIHTLFPSGERLTELVSLELADKAGRWEGDCGRRTCTVRIPLQESAYFNQAGDYTLTVEQYMRRNPLPGVNRLAFMLEETEVRR